MALSPRVIQWSGTIYNQTSAGTAIEIWSNTVHVMADTTLTDQDIADGASLVYGNVFSTTNAKIHATVAFEVTKASTIDITTGAWLADPVPQTLTTIRGQVTGFAPAVTTSCRLSIDDSSRDRKHKGGFYLPRVAMNIGDDGLFNTTQVGTFVTAWQGMLQSLETHFTPEVDLGIYSKAGASFAVANRLRVGQVPDNIRRRKNNIPEAYSVVSL